MLNRDQIDSYVKALRTSDFVQINGHTVTCISPYQPDGINDVFVVDETVLTIYPHVVDYIYERDPIFVFEDPERAFEEKHILHRTLTMWHDLETHQWILSKEIPPNANCELAQRPDLPQT